MMTERRHSAAPCFLLLLGAAEGCQSLPPEMTKPFRPCGVLTRNRSGYHHAFNRCLDLY